MKKILALFTFFFCILHFELSFSQVPSYVPSSGLVGYWPFNGNANDASGNGNNGTVNGATLTNDRKGLVNSAYYFSCNSIQCNINTSSIATSMTLSFWYLRNTAGCIGPRVMEFSQGSNLPGELIIEENYPTGLRIGHVTTAGLANTLGWMQFNSRNNQVWSFYVYTNDGQTAKIYQDGVLLNQYTSPGLPILDGNVAFGWMNHPANDGVNGMLDDIGLWNRALTQSEITALYTGVPACIANITNNDTTICPGSSISLNAFNAVNNTLSSCSWQQVSTGDCYRLVAGSSGKLFIPRRTDMLKSNDNGVTWTSANWPLGIVRSGTSLTNGSVFNSVTNQIIQCALDNGYWVSNDNGITFTQTGPTGFGCVGVEMLQLKNGRVLATMGGFQRGVYKSNDLNNNTWSNKYAGTDPYDFTSFNDSLIFCGTSNYLLKSIDQGDTWVTLLNDNITDVEKIQDSLLWINSIGNVYISAKQNISSIVSPVSNLGSGYFDAKYDSASRTLIVTKGTTGIYFSKDNGRSWISCSISGAINYYDVTIYQGRVYVGTDVGLYSITLNNTSYLWSTGATTPTITVSPTVSTTYYCTVSDGTTTCTDSVRVTVNPINRNFFTQDTIRACGSTYALSAGTGYSSYAWNTGATTSSINVTSTGWYKCAISNGTCSATDSVFVSLVYANIVNNDTAVCSGASVTLTATGSSTSAASSSLPSNLRNGLVAYYPFNGNANDESGNGNNGTVNGATLTTDRFGNVGTAYNFNGVDNYITSNSYFLNASLAHTISIWWQTSDSTKVAQTLFNTNPHTIENCAFHYSTTSLTPPYAISYGMGNGNSGVGSWNVAWNDTSQILNTPNTKGNWHNFVWSKQNTPNWGFYMDGNLIYNFQSSVNVGSILSNLRFGAENNGYQGGGANFKGNLDDIAIYNRTLSSSEIQQLYNQGNVTYSWSNGATTPTIAVTPTSTTTYYCTVSNGISSCVDSVRVTVNLKPTVSTVTGASRCGTGTVTLSATTTTGNTIDWYASDTSAVPVATGVTSYTTPSLSATKTYFVRARNTTTGCVSLTSTAVTATINAIPAAPAATGASRCGSGTVTLTATVATGTSPAWYNVSSGGTALSTSSSYTTPTLTATTNYYVAAIGTGSCASTRTLAVATINALPATPTGSDSSRCGTGTVTLKAATATGSTVDWYAASSGGTALLSGSLTYTTPSISATTIYYAQARNTTTGCVSATRKAISAIINPSVTPTFAFIPYICSGSVAPILPTVSTNGVTGIWSPAVVSNTVTANYTFTPSAGQCASTVITTVTVMPNATPTFNLPTSVCSGAAATSLPSISTNGIYGTWSPAIMNTSATTTYTFTPSAGQCSNSTSITIRVDTLRGNFLRLDTIIACGASTILNAGSGYVSYVWNTGATDSLIYATQSGWYSCLVSNGNCSTRDSVFVSIVNANIINNDTTICGGSVTLTASGGSPSTVRDVNGNIYPTIKIGDQLWIQKNLNVSRYKNGDIIPQVTDPTQWASLTTGAWCWYNNDSATYGATYGKLYNWYAVNDPRGLAPEGWHIPSSPEWNTLVKYLDINADTNCISGCSQSLIAGNYIMEAGTSHWLSTNASITNSTGFTALPAGYRDGAFNGGGYNEINMATYYWSRAIPNSNDISYRILSYGGGAVTRYDFNNNQTFYRAGFSVRALQNTPTYLWSNGATTPTITVSPTTTTTYYCTVSNGISSCRDSVKITVSGAVPTTPLSIIGSTDICGFIGSDTASVPVTYKTNKVANATTYTWTVPTGVTLLSGQGDTSITVRFSSSFSLGNITVKASNTCGSSSTRTLTVYKRVPTAPAAIQKEFSPVSIAAVTDVCGVTSEIYRIRKVTYATSYDWSLKVGTYATITHLNALGINDTAIRVTYNTGFTRDTISVKSVNACSVSAAKTIIVSTVFAPPTVTSMVSSSGNFTPCIGNSVTYTASATVPNYSQSAINVYRWTRPSYTTILSASSDSSSITLQYNTGFAGGSLIVKGQSACGITGTAYTSIVYYSAPAPTSITSSTGSYNACIGNIITYTASSPAPTGSQVVATVYRWTIPSNTSIVSANADSSIISVSFNTGYVGGTLSVKGQNRCGVTSSAKTVSLTHTGCAAGSKSGLTTENYSTELKLYPNPTVGVFNLYMNGLNTKALIRITDLQGRFVKSYECSKSLFTIPNQDLKPGVYFIEVKIGNEVKTIKAVKL